MNRCPLISIVTVVCNDDDGLRQTARSVDKQTYSNYEWIIVNGCLRSSLFDEPVECVSLQNSVLISEPDDGIYDAMNKGVAHSSGIYVVFMNAGDKFYEPDTLKKVAETIDGQGGNADIVLGGADMVFRSGKRWRRPPREMEKYIWHGLPANHQASYFRRELLVAYPYDTGYRVCGDYYLFCRLYQHGVNTVLVDFPLVSFRVGDTSYKRPFSVISEALEIQKEVLRLSWFMRMLSMGRRLVSITGALLMNVSSR